MLHFVSEYNVHNWTQNYVGSWYIIIMIIPGNILSSILYFNLTLLTFSDRKKEIIKKIPNKNLVTEIICLGGEKGG